MGRAEIETAEDAPFTRCYDPPNDFPALPADLDYRIWSWSPDDGRCGYLPKPELPGSLYKAMETHVLLAACQPRQRARETQNSGVPSGAFTTALMASLRAWDPTRSSLTYSRLMEHLSPLYDQHPHCEGNNKVRHLFSPSDHGKDDPSWFVVTAADSATDNTYYVAAGYLLGIVKGTEFITHPPKGSTPLTLVATIVEEFRCLAVPRHDQTATDDHDPDSQLPFPSILPHHSRATILKWTTKWLQVELDPREAFPHITEDKDTLFSIVESGGELKVSRADSASKTVQLVRNDPLIRSQPECHRISVNFNAFTRYYLDKAARFHFFLYQHNKYYNSTQLYRSLDNPDPNSISVTTSLQRLTWTTRLTGPWSFVPVGDNLFQVPVDADITRNALAGAAVLEGLASDLQYGLTLENHTSTDFFPYVFFFDPREYVIEVSLIKLSTIFFEGLTPVFKPLYLPHSPISRPLTRCGTDGSTLGIGYGAQGTESISFPLPDGFDHDSGFIKVFVSTVYINMEAIVAKAERVAIEFNWPDIEQCWDSWTYLITVRR